MQDRPTAAELLDAVRGFLETDVIPASEGRNKFHTRVAVNVLSIVSRELALEPLHRKSEWQRLERILGSAPMPEEGVALREALAQRTERLCERIRRGEADHGETRQRVLQHVRETVREKLAIANPGLLREPGEGG
jgi:Domain of unknown function (DUF6285)